MADLQKELYCLSCSFRTTGRKQICRVCRREFIARASQLHSNVVCCSKSCAIRWRYEIDRMNNRARKLPRKECTWCHSLFKPRLRIQQFCSVQCASNSRGNEIKQKTPWVMRICPVCEQKFKVKKSQVDAGHGLLCSLRCRGIYGAQLRKNRLILAN
jgi:hypothetical protein